jgi:hypothetical protein
MNEANTMADILGADEAGECGRRPGEPFPRDPRCPEQPRRTTEELALGFCGFLTVDIPELHGMHPQRLADAWERFKVRAEELGQFFAPNGEG